MVVKGKTLYLRTIREKDLDTLYELTCDILFAIYKINRLELKIFPENGPSKRVAEKSGYKLEGVARGAYFHRGAYHDLEVHSILREEAPATLAEAVVRLER